MATGTIYRTVYNSLDEALSDWVGTNDTPTSGEWSPSNNTGTANMGEVSSYQYDNGGAGDGNLTQETDYPGLGEDNRVTDFWYDWRDRLVAQKSGVQSSENDGVHRPIIVTTYDNLDEAVETQQYVGDGVTPNIAGGVLQALPANDLRAQEIDSYDDQGRVYRTQVYDVNPSTGVASGSALTTNYYYDHRGDLMAESDPGGLWTKSVYDGAGRDVTDYTTDGAGGTTWGEAASVVGDTVLEQEQTVYDGDGNAIETIDSQRFHNATGTGPLGTPTSGIGARVYYTAEYYDNADRVIADVDAGTNGGTAWTRPGTVPSSSSTLLVTNYLYSYDGSVGAVLDVIDPMGIDTHYIYDNLGRMFVTIQDFTGQAETAQSDIETNTYYDGNNNLIAVVAYEPGGSYQYTRYVYGVTTASGSGVNSNDILSAVQHPDPSTGNPSPTYQDSYLTNALGQVVQYTDPNVNVHQYSYDVLGRETSDAVASLGAGEDGTIRQITYGYDTQGNLSLISSYNEPSGGSIVNQVQDVYNGLGQLTGEYQSHSGAVVQGSTPEVQYAYNEMSNGENNSRLTSITYPSGYMVKYNYNSGLDDSISRLSSISDSGGTLESYKYLGLDTVVEMDHPQTGINLTYISQTGQNGSAGDQYSGLDQFGRVVDQNWYDTTTQSSVDDYQYSYNPDSEVLSRNNTLDPALNESYAYNNLGELTSFQRGSSYSRTWTPDALGNFSSVTTNGSTQTRTANQQNEYTYISTNTAVSYDANGNLITDGTGWTYTYDAWNRLISATANGTVIAKYGYDGLNRQVQITENGGTSDLYYSSSGQVLEEYGSGNTVVTAIDVWSPVYVNALVYREQGGVRYYALQDGNWNVTAWVDASGNVAERYAYDAYGIVTTMDANWNVKLGTTLGGIPYGFQGMRDDWWVGNLNFSQSGRVENPGIGNWQQTDPLGLSAGNNDDEMEGDGPTNAVDPSGLDGVADWKKRAEQQLHAYPPKTVEDVIKNNRKITAFYASMFKNDPTVYIWFGLAAYASSKVGEGLRQATSWPVRMAPGAEPFGNKPATVFALLALGNMAINLDIAWVALAYQKGGIEELDKCKKSIDPSVYRAFVLIDKALHTKDPNEKRKLAIKAARALVEREQKVLQGVLDKAPKEVVRKMNLLLQIPPPSFRGAEWGLGDFGDLNYRLSRIYQVILPSFLVYLFQSPEKIMKFTEEQIAEGK